jgi:hypothetical protein
MAGGSSCDLIKFEIFQNHSNSIQTKTNPPVPQKIELKYGWWEFEVRNNFPYKGFLRFKMDFGLKFREVSMGWNQGKITGNSWKFGIWWNLANKLLVTPYCKKKYISSKRRPEFWIPFENGIRIDFPMVWNLDLIFKFHLWI